MVVQVEHIQTFKMRKLIIAILFFTSVLNAQTYQQANIFIQDSMKLGTSANSVWSDSITAGSIIHWLSGQSYIMDGSDTAQYTATYFVATPANGGSDANPGTFASPFATWEHLDQVMSAGDTAYIRGGTYRSPVTGVTNIVNWDSIGGTITDTIKIWNYPGEIPILNMDDQESVAQRRNIVRIYGDYIHIKGLHITGATQNPQPAPSDVFNFLLDTCNNVVIENCVVYETEIYGYWITNSKHITFKNCDAYDIADPESASPYNGANGFSISGASNLSDSIYYQGCRAWFISDDGFEIFNSTNPATNGAYVTYDSCWAFWNGFLTDFTEVGDGQGFKLGQLNGEAFVNVHLRTLTNCLAVGNASNGFDANGGRCKMTLYNNTAYDNEDRGFSFQWNLATVVDTFMNNIDFGSAFGPLFNDSEIDDSNSWNISYSMSNSDFVSTDSSQLIRPRKTGGSLPDIDAYNLAPGSPLIDRGIDVGLPFEGTAPDVGAFERESSPFAFVLSLLLFMNRRNRRRLKHNSHGN